jgi:4-amino-4-deoxy-L-arabinose transferase-like glycosyltransferase
MGWTFPLNKDDRHQRASTLAPRAPHIVAVPRATLNESYPLAQAQASAQVTEANVLWPSLWLVAAFALATRLFFLAVTSDTYDYDEFVALLLGRDWAHGALPYRDFMFFHPPGILVIARAFEPLFQMWWPASRVLTAALDAGTAVLVAHLAARLWGRRAGLAAGLVYALSPVALVSGVRFGEDPIITFLGILGLVLLLRGSARASLAAGICLGLALWVKYPAAYFVPVYLLAAPRRAIPSILTAAVTFTALMLPFTADWHAIYEQSVVFQRGRWSMDVPTRIQTTVLYWLAANALAVLAVVVSARSRARTAVPRWALAGFFLGAVFAINSQVYYHYFVVVAPFAALLGGWLLSRVGRTVALVLLPAGIAIAVSWGALLQLGGPAPLFVTAAHLSDLEPTIQLLDRSTPPSGRVLSDRFEYAYLAGRPAVDRYFWNVGVLVGRNDLERQLGPVSAVVLSQGASSGFPLGFVPYLNDHYRSVQTRTNTVWIARR